MKKRLTTLISSLLVGAMVLTGCGSTGTSEPTTTPGATSVETTAPAETTATGDKIAKLVSGTEPGSLHPALAQGTHESIILDHVYEGLMKRDENSQIVPGMAESYTMSDDGLTYTFKIRDAQWSNGDPVTAGDFETAWKFALDPASASDYAFQLYYIEGGQAYNEGTGTADAVAIKAIDDKTLEVKLTAPTAYFLELCAFYTYYPVNKTVQQANGAAWANDGSTFVSNGPFVVTEWNHDESVVLTKNANYYNKDAVKLDGIEFILSDDQNTQWQMYENGEIDLDHDLPVDVLGQLKAASDPELKTETELATYFYRFNTTVKPFNNVKVREALSMAIDRQLIIDEVTQGGQFPAYGVVPEGVADASGDFRQNGGDYFKEDVAAAKVLLAEGLKEEGMDTLSFSILYNTSEGHKKIAEAIQQMWKENLNVDVTLENVEFQVKIDREHALDYEVSRAGWVGDYIDPNTFLDMFAGWSSQNDTGWTSAAYDELVTKAAAEFDVATRMGYLHDAEKLLMTDLPIMPIYYYTKSWTTKPHLVGVNKAVNREVSLIYADIVK